MVTLVFGFFFTLGKQFAPECIWISKRNRIVNVQLFLGYYLFNDSWNLMKKWSVFFNLITWIALQVNLCQKLLFLHKLTHDMRSDCSLKYMKIPSSNLGRTCYVQKLFLTFRNICCTQHVLPIFCKMKRFWQRFTCTVPSFHCENWYFLSFTLTGA